MHYDFWNFVPMMAVTLYCAKGVGGRAAQTTSTPLHNLTSDHFYLPLMRTATNSHLTEATTGKGILNFVMSVCRRQKGHVNEGNDSVTFLTTEVY
jgi:hypothetical protein